MESTLPTVGPSFEEPALQESDRSPILPLRIPVHEVAEHSVPEVLRRVAPGRWLDDDRCGGAFVYIWIVKEDDRRRYFEERCEHVPSGLTLENVILVREDNYAITLFNPKGPDYFCFRGRRYRLNGQRGQWVTAYGPRRGRRLI